MVALTSTASSLDDHTEWRLNDLYARLGDINGKLDSILERLLTPDPVVEKLELRVRKIEVEVASAKAVTDGSQLATKRLASAAMLVATVLPTILVYFKA